MPIADEHVVPFLWHLTGNGLPDVGHKITLVWRWNGLRAVPNLGARIGNLEKRFVELSGLNRPRVAPVEIGRHLKTEPSPVPHRQVVGEEVFENLHKGV